MKLVRYTSQFNTRVVVHIDTGRKFTRIITMDYPPRIEKIPREEERRMIEIPVTKKNNVKNFLQRIRERYLLGKKLTISQEVADLLELPASDSI
jgi:hypothetical protein